MLFLVTPREEEIYDECEASRCKVAEPLVLISSAADATMITRLQGAEALFQPYENNP